jgi:hypothetical protein
MSSFTSLLSVQHALNARIIGVARLVMTSLMIYTRNRKLHIYKSKANKTKRSDDDDSNREIEPKRAVV